MPARINTPTFGRRAVPYGRVQEETAKMPDRDRLTYRALPSADRMGADCLVYRWPSAADLESALRRQDADGSLLESQRHVPIVRRDPITGRIPASK